MYTHNIYIYIHYFDMPGSHAMPTLRCALLRQAPHKAISSIIT